MDATRVPVDVAGSHPGSTNSYVIGQSGALLVDPAARDDELESVIDECAVDHVAVTHHHPDHVGAVADYAHEYGLTVWARTGHKGDFEAATGVYPDLTFAEGSVVPAGDGPIRVLETPGHAPEHVAFAFSFEENIQNDPETGVAETEDARPPAAGSTGGIALAVGDVAVETGSVVVGAPEGDMRAYLSSLRRLHARNPTILFPGHGPPIEDARDTLSRLIAHRLRREQRVASAVRTGAETADEVVDIAYEKDLTGVRDLAVATATAHLEKLAIEGRVQWDGERATQVPET